MPFLPTLPQPAIVLQLFSFSNSFLLQCKTDEMEEMKKVSTTFLESKENSGVLTNNKIYIFSISVLIRFRKKNCKLKLNLNFWYAMKIHFPLH